jgi:hypothetical protein
MAEAQPKTNVGQEIPSLAKTAYMPIDPNTRNVIHTDDYAKDFGMRGALIGGSTLLSYVLEMLFAYFGRNWFEHGRIKVSYIGGGAVNDRLRARGRRAAAFPGRLAREPERGQSSGRPGQLPGLNPLGLVAEESDISLSLRGAKRRGNLV